MAPVGTCLGPVDRARDEQRDAREVHCVPESPRQPSFAPRRHLNGNKEIQGDDPPRHGTGLPRACHGDQQVGNTEVDPIVGNERA